METTKVSTFRLFIRLISLIGLVFILIPQPVQAADICDTGTWVSGNLEIHHIDIGQGDAALIVGPTGKSMLLDAGETNWNSSAKAQIIGPYIQGVLGCKSLDYVLISHFHLDHVGYVGYGGLWNLVETQGFTVGTTLVRDYNHYLGDGSGTFTNWKTYLEGTGQAKLHPMTAIEGASQVALGPGVIFKIVALDGNGALFAGDFHGDTNPPSENDYSIGAVLSYGNFDEWMGGDIDGQYESSGLGYSYHDIELSVAPEVGDVDVYKANHHGSSHSSSATFINQLDPEVSIINVGDGNTYGHPTQQTMDRLLTTSTVYLTERGDTNTNIGSAIVAGNIVIKTNGSTYTVNGTPYTATEPTRSDTDGDGYFAEADPNNNDASIKPSPNGGCDSTYQTCSTSPTPTASSACQVTPGQVVINEVLPAPSNNGTEWAELYNTTSSSIDIGNCYVDDVAGQSPAYQVPASTFIPAHGFWTVDQISYFNNTGDSVRFLKEDSTTLLDSFTFGSTGYNLSWYRLPDGGNWAGSPTASTTKGQSNTIPFYPVVLSSARANANPTSAASVTFTVTFSNAVTGVNATAFGITQTGIAGAYVSSVNGSGATYTVTVSTGSGNGTIRLDVIDNDSIRDSSNHPLGGAGAGNGNFNSGETYTIQKTVGIAGNTGVAGVLLSYTGGSISSDASGNYYFIVPIGWSSTVTPSKPGYTFSPASRTYTNVMSDQPNQNYTAIPYYSISGNVDVAGATLSYTDGTPKTVTSLIDGSYTLSVPGGWSGTVTPSHPCFNFTPTSWDYNNLAGNVTAQDFTPSLNVASGCADVDIAVRRIIQGRFGLLPHGSLRASLPGINDGPIVFNSTNNLPLIAAERVIYKVNGVNTSFTEMMGMPESQLTNIYWLPWYNNVDLDTQLRFANVSDSTATVHIFIGGVEITTYILPSGQSTRVSFPGVNNGPVKIESDQNIVAAERVIYKVNEINTSFTEMMALPNSQLTNTYWLPWYNNTDLDTQLRFGNVSSDPATVHIYIGTEEMPGSPFTLQPGQSTRQSFKNVNNGPVKIESDQNIVAAERVIYKVSGTNTSFTEMMALPNSQLNTTYWLPWYNNTDLDTQLRFGNVSGNPAQVHVFIGGVEMHDSPFTLGVGQSVRLSFTGVNNGPVQIQSDQPIVAAERVIYKVNGIPTSFSEMMGLPDNQLNAIYWLPWYNNVDLDTQLRFGVP